MIVVLQKTSWNLGLQNIFHGLNIYICVIYIYLFIIIISVDCKIYSFIIKSYISMSACSLNIYVILTYIYEVIDK